MKVCFALLTVLFATVRVTAKTIRVPANQPTIQAAINAAVDGDTVLVSSGTYTENIDLAGKNIVVASSKGPAVTIIDGNSQGSVVQFVSGETTKSILRGFTVRNGYASVSNSSGYGGGIYIRSSSPTITGNIISRNQADSGGGGIAVFSASPQIMNNKITNNSQSPNSTLGLGGAGVLIYGPSSPHLISNVISGNSFIANGGGVTVESATAPVLMNNSITNNSGIDGGGIWVENTQFASIIQNVITGNFGRDGGGIMLFPLSSTETALLVNNTVAGNSASSGSAVFIFGTDTGVRFYNNLFIGLTGFDAVACNGTGGSVFFNTDAFEPASGGFAGTCVNQSGTNGNVSVDPKFVSPTSNNYKLKGGSPAIDLGTNTAPNLPATDFAKNPRTVDGNGGLTAIVDMGAYEFIPVVLAPKSLTFGLHSVGSTTTKIVKLTNAQNKALSISSFSLPTGYSVTGCGPSVAAFTTCSLTVAFHPFSAGTFKGTLRVNDSAGNSPQLIGLSGTAQ